MEFCAPMVPENSTVFLYGDAISIPLYEKTPFPAGQRTLNAKPDQLRLARASSGTGNLDQARSTRNTGPNTQSMQQCAAVNLDRSMVPYETLEGSAAAKLEDTADAGKSTACADT